MTPALLAPAPREENQMTKSNAAKKAKGAPAGDYVADMLARDAELARKVDEELTQMRVLDDLIRLRERRGLSQTQLARMLGISQSAIAQLEGGKAKNLGIRTLARVATALGGKLVVALEPREDE